MVDDCHYATYEIWAIELVFEGGAAALPKRHIPRGTDA